ncbi:HAD-like domain-containing protein [Dendryphion nanum]|uniref:HAD-like domain-containing protein n=1 Tax=Dendryphion nanum TaxID=256645 RepID=A0A9P9E7X3_9PLEO|nr:HAD-like domain-containing protein [Dendryphion nanum]
MAPQPPPKAILFDIGGVCVISPFQAILDYERAHSIPPGYINFSIQKGPHDTGAWQLIERGETILDDTWFAAFKAQLSIPAHWTEFWRTKTDAGRHGAPVPPVPDINAKSMFWEMMRTSRAPDPWMYPALKKLGASRKYVLGALSNTVAFPTGIVDDKGVLYTKGLLHAPKPNPYAEDSTDIADCFDLFLSSAHIGVRKPDPKAYELAVRELDKVAREKGLGGVTAGDVLFLDDIGVNLKWARKSGLRTIKVDLGRTKEAVRELENQTGESLLDDKARL